MLNKKSKASTLSLASKAKKGERVLSSHKSRHLPSNNNNSDVFANFEVDLDISDIQYRQALGKKASMVMSSKTSDRIGLVLLTENLTQSPTLMKQDYSPASNQ